VVTLPLDSLPSAKKMLPATFFSTNRRGGAERLGNFSKEGD